MTGKTNYEPLSQTADVQNRLTGFGYDAAGNMISNGSATYVYDAETQLKSASGMFYTYDGDGYRVRKCNADPCTSSSTGTLYWPNVQGDATAESDLAGTMQAEYIFFNGRRVARRDVASSAVHYYFSDQLGSASVVTNATGTAPFEEDLDYYPFGGIVPTSSDVVPQHYKFTGKERDSESGLDNFGARHYSSPLGRFQTPDPVKISWQRLLSPQLWNGYNYVGNNPLNFIDPTGEELVQLGQHTDDQINKRTKEISRQLKDKNLSKADKDKLKAERKTLALEKEGNAVGRAYLASLEKIGQRNGLQLSDITLTTDPRHDFAGQGLTQEQMDKITSPRTQGFVLNRGGQIYLPTGSASYTRAHGDTELDDFGGTVLRHEQVHVQGGGEFQAYTVQRQIFQLFRRDFTLEHFRFFDEQLRRSIDENRPPQ